MFGGSNYTLFRYFLALKIIRLSLYLFTTLNLSGRNGEMFQAICMKNKLNSSLSPHKDVRGYNKKHLVTLQPPKDRGGGGYGMVWYGFTAWTLGLFACLWDS